VLVFYVSIHVRGRTTKHFELLAGAVCGGGWNNIMCVCQTSQ
jgi:hypothetical protein